MSTYSLETTAHFSKAVTMSKTAEVTSSSQLSDGSSDNHVARPTANASPSKDRGFFAWFDDNDGPVERKLILKLDLLNLSFACMGFWVSYRNALMTVREC